MINYNNWMINMNTIHKMSICVVLIAILALVPNVSATGYMDGNNWTGIDNILDSYGFSYLKNNSGMTNPATADLDMGNYNITGLGQSESYSYLIWTDGTTVYAKNGSTGVVDYSGTEPTVVFSSAQNDMSSGGIIRFIGKQIIINGSFTITKPMTIIGTTETIIKNQDNSIYLTSTPNSAMFNISSSDVILYGLNLDGNNISNNGIISGGGTGIKIQSSLTKVVNVKIINNIISNQSYVGIFVTSGVCSNIICAKDIIIDNNKITQPQYHDAISIHNTDGASIINNVIYSSMGDGIHIYTQNNNTIISGNTYYLSSSIDSGLGITVGSLTSPNTIKNTVISMNRLINENITGNNYVGIAVLEGANNTIITDNYIKNSIRGIWISNSVGNGLSGVIITNNIIDGSLTHGACGIWLYNFSNGLIKNNIIDAGTTANICKYTLKNSVIITDNILKNTTSGVAIIDNSEGVSYSYNNYGASPFNFGKSATAPTAQSAGDTYFNTTNKQPYFHNGTIFITGYGEGSFTLTNGTNDIAVGTTNTKYWFSSGIVTALSLSAVESGNFNLSVNNTATGCLNYITLSSAQNNMTSGLNCVYNAGDRMNFTVISNSGIHQVSVGAKYTKTS